MEGDRQQFPFLIFQQKRKSVSLLETDFFKWYKDDFLLYMVVIPDHEVALSELLVPADSVQKFLNGYHPDSH